ncbi:hypothetical protein V6Z11_A12G030100 [Gossypium hirsutum]
MLHTGFSFLCRKQSKGRMIVGSAWRSNGNIFLSISFCLSASFL